MASRKDEKDRLRAQRLEAERRAADAARRRLLLGYVVAGVLALAVVAGIAVVIASGGGGGGAGGDTPDAAHVNAATGSLNGFAPDGREGTPPPAVRQADLQKAADDAGCELRIGLPDEGSGHLGGGEETPDYDTDPPTSGDHSASAQADGAYSEYPDPIHTVHSLEHGRIDVQYSPRLSEANQLAIKGVFDESPGAMLLFPNPEMPYEVAATAWTQLLGCDSFEGAATLDALRDFRDTFRGQGLEAVPFTP